MSSPESGNMDLWNSVKTTSARYTKDGNQDGRKVTSINHIGMLEKATELWGPIGVRWGYEIVEERDDQGKPNWNGELMVGHDITHTLRLRLWFPGENGDRGSIENYGHTPRIYWSHQKKYFVEDKDYAKKSLTDAFKKCMSFLGFSADVYGGEWDDPEYRRERVTEAHDEKARERMESQRKQFIDGKRHAYTASPNAAALKSYHENTVKQMQTQVTNQQMTREEYDLRLAALVELAREIRESKNWEATGDNQ